MYNSFIFFLDLTDYPLHFDIFTDHHKKFSKCNKMRSENIGF